MTIGIIMILMTSVLALILLLTPRLEVSQIPEHEVRKKHLYRLLENYLNSVYPSFIIECPGIDAANGGFIFSSSNHHKINLEAQRKELTQYLRNNLTNTEFATTMIISSQSYGIDYKTIRIGWGHKHPHLNPHLAKIQMTLENIYNTLKYGVILISSNLKTTIQFHLLSIKNLFQQHTRTTIRMTSTAAKNRFLDILSREEGVSILDKESLEAFRQSESLELRVKYEKSHAEEIKRSLSELPKKHPSLILKETQNSYRVSVKNLPPSHKIGTLTQQKHSVLRKKENKTPQEPSQTNWKHKLMR